jgi:hypothetical protein
MRHRADYPVARPVRSTVNITVATICDCLFAGQSI